MNAQIISALGRDELGEEFNLKIDIENTGAVDYKEVVQVYVRDVESSVKRPLKELKDFKKVDLTAGDLKQGKPAGNTV